MTFCMPTRLGTDASKTLAPRSRMRLTALPASLLFSTLSSSSAYGLPAASRLSAVSNAWLSSNGPCVAGTITKSDTSQATSTTLPAGGQSMMTSSSSAMVLRSRFSLPILAESTVNVRVSPASSASPAHVVASPCGSVSSTDTLRLCRAAAVANAMAVVVLPLPPLRLMTEMIMKVPPLRQSIYIRRIYFLYIG